MSQEEEQQRWEPLRTRCRVQKLYRMTDCRPTHLLQQIRLDTWRHARTRMTSVSCRCCLRACQMCDVAREYNGSVFVNRAGEVNEIYLRGVILSQQLLVVIHVVTSLPSSSFRKSVSGGTRTRHIHSFVTGQCRYTLGGVTGSSVISFFCKFTAECDSERIYENWPISDKKYTAECLFSWTRTETGPNNYQRCRCCWGSCCDQIFKVLKLFRFSNDRN